MKVLALVALICVVGMINGQKEVGKVLKAIRKWQNKIDKAAPPSNIARILNDNGDCLKTVLPDGTM